MTSAPPDAVVVGSGPNGLAAAVTLARAGLGVQVLEGQQTLGGGARTVDLGLAEGVRHDLCSAVHPMALASPFLREFDLAARGVRTAVPEVSYAHPLPGGDAGIAWHDLERAVEGLGADGPAWRRIFGPLVEQSEAVAALALGDKRSIPPEMRHPGALAASARFGAMTLLQGTPAWDRPLRTERARALLTGVSAHGISPLPSLAAAGVSLLLATLAHGEGWPIPRGGSQVIVDALLEDLLAHGGTVERGRPVRSLQDLPPARAIVLDTSADGAARILGRALPRRTSRGLMRLGHAGAAAKVDLVTNGPIPWTHPDVGRAGTVHLGGTRSRIAEAENQVLAGRMPESPMVLVSDPAVVDPGREVGGLRPIWAYAHVPVGSTLDPTTAVIEQIERSAPGFRDTVVAARGIPAARMGEHDAAIVGGDIGMGTITMARMIARPRAAWNPYRLTDQGHYLCSAATPPGPGVHGLGGHRAALHVLRERFGVRTAPRLGPDGSAPGAVPR